MLTPEDIQVNKTYRAKRPRKGRDLFNNLAECMDDRTVLWISRDRTKVQYDHPFISIGRHYPTTTMERFLKWAKEEVIPSTITS